MFTHMEAPIFSSLIFCCIVFHRTNILKYVYSFYADINSPGNILERERHTYTHGERDKVISFLVCFFVCYSVSLCSLCWPVLHPTPASVSQVLGLQLYTTMPGLNVFLKNVHGGGNIGLWGTDISKDNAKKFNTVIILIYSPVSSVYGAPYPHGCMML
jgi:hypothetical protein